MSFDSIDSVFNCTWDNLLIIWSNFFHTHSSNGHQIWKYHREWPNCKDNTFDSFSRPVAPLLCPSAPDWLLTFNSDSESIRMKSTLKILPKMPLIELHQVRALRTKRVIMAGDIYDKRQLEEESRHGKHRTIKSDFD